MVSWEIKPQTKTGSQGPDIFPYLKTPIIGWRLNRPPTISGGLNTTDPVCKRDWLTPGVHEAKVYRNGVAQEGVFRLTGAPVSLGISSASVGLQYEGIETYASELELASGLVVASAVQSTQAWGLLTSAAAHTEYSFAQGLVPATDPTRAAWTVRSDTDALSELQLLSERKDGFDYAFNADRELDLYYPNRGSALPFALVWEENVFTGGWDEQAGPGMIASELIGYDGAGNTVTRSSAAVAALYGKRQHVLRLQNLSGSTELGDYMDAGLEVMSAPVMGYSVRVDPSKIPWGTYWLGDTAQFVANTGYLDIDAEVRIVGITVARTKTGTERVALELQPTLPMRVENQLVRKLAASGNGGLTNGVLTQSPERRLGWLEGTV